MTITISPEELRSLLSGTSDDSVQQKLDRIIAQNEELKRMTAETQALLTQIDETTNAIATNVGTIGGIATTISNELDTLIAQTSDADVKAKLTDLSGRLSAVADAAGTQVEVLNAIAAKGAPVVPPPPEVVNG